MWWELAIDVLWPTRAPKSVERSVERIVDKGVAGTLRVECGVAGAFKRRLNESGWLADEVIEAGMLQQGTPPSLLALTTGLGLFQMARSRRSQSLPREFALAVTADRVVAFALSPWKEGERTTDSVAAVRIKPGQVGSWPRDSVRLTDLHKRAGTKGGTLEVAGEEPFPITCDGDPSTGELIELLISNTPPPPLSGGPNETSNP
jgi:hypothetical protein